ncbi:DUF6262 family protein [Streptomyces actuosus]|uniref:DUF6262 family protein n=1 Tax=Streptomyces actuosus TaxID=1885 RepID=UPI0027DA845B|nr:DUF6262 family protein [Streptomyces actuosus]
MDRKPNAPAAAASTPAPRPVQALRSLDAAGEPVTFEHVAKRAGVSRSWLFAQPDLRAEIERLRAVQGRYPASPIPARQRTTDASLLRRLEAADARIRRLTEEDQRLREQLARALGEQRTATHRTGPPRAGARNVGADRFGFPHPVLGTSPYLRTSDPHSEVREPSGCGRRCVVRNALAADAGPIGRRRCDAGPSRRRCGARSRGAARRRG